MDDTQKDGSDSDWDSTLDFTSPRGGAGHFQPPINIDNTEIEEESALSEESDVDGPQSLPIDNPVIKNVLKPVDNRQRSPSPDPSQHSQKESNLVLAQKQQNVQAKQGDRKRKDQPANQQVQKKENNPPYNFREAVNGQTTPEPATRGPPGKDRKGNVYDPAPSPTPRGIPSKQGSIRSVGSWDESDADERTLKELRQNYTAQKQREAQKVKETEEQKSMVEDPPQTARSEGTWRSWAGNKLGKRSKQSQSPQPASTKPGSQPLTARSQQQEHMVVPRTVDPPRMQVSPPSVRETYEPRYQGQTVSLEQIHYQGNTSPLPFVREEEIPFDEPKHLVVRDEDKGQYVYFFGHGNLRYYEVNEEYEEAVLPSIADKIDKISHRAWQEIFAIFRIILSFFIAFAVEFFKFLARHIFQPLILGIFVTFGDFIMKPFLSALFNGFMQPLSIFFWNMFTGLRHMFRPFGEILKSIFEQLAMLFRSIRFFEITYVSKGINPAIHDQQYRVQSV